MRRTLMASALVLIAIAAVACNTQGSSGGDGDSKLSGSIQIDGSSTVYPISEGVAEEFGKDNRGVNVRVGQSGTGGGFKKFCNGETDISDASRPIEEDEKKACSDKDISYTELKIAIDGLSVVVNGDNDFADCITTAELKKLWEPKSTVKTWQDIRPAWPAETLKLYGPGADSGTFDFFTKAINGEEDASRSDYTQSEDDNVLVQGVAGDKNGLGYFGFAYYEQNQDKLNVLGIDSGDGCVKPSQESIKAGKYTPLSRPLFVYVTDEALKREEVKGFVTFYLDNVNAILQDVGYIDLPAKDLEASKTTLSEATG